MIRRLHIAALVIPAGVVVLAQATPDFSTIIERFGFPAAVAAFVLIRVERSIKELTNAVTALTLQMAKKETQ